MERSTRNTKAIYSCDSGGRNFPIVFLHGSASSSAAFDRQFSSPLANHFRLITLDLPGHGKSADAQEPSKEYAIQGLAETVSRALENLGIESAVIVGWSLGGHVAIELMANTNLVAGLVLTGTPPITPGPMGLLRGFQLSPNMLLTSKPNYTPEDAARMVRLCFDEDTPANAMEMALRSDGQARSTVARSFLFGSGISDQRRAVQTASVPITFIEGENDPFIRLGYVPTIDIPTMWDRRVLADTGHAPFWERHETFNAILQHFVFDAAIARVPVKKSAFAELPRRQQARR